MYNCVDSTVLGSDVGFFLVFRSELNTGWEENNPVGLGPGFTPVVSTGNSVGMRGREYLEIIFNKRWGNGVR